MKPQLQRQSGTALVVALLIVVIVSTMVTSLASRLNVDIHRGANLLAYEQALETAYGVEAWAVATLHRDAKESEYDHPGEIWAQPLPVTEVENGLIAGRIVDLSGRFDLNSLINNSGVADESRRTTFVRLLSALDVPPDFANTVLDWQDTDAQQRFPNGAEDLEYLSRKPSYRTPNRKLGHVSELRLMRDMDEEQYQRLAPHVVSFPDATPININTASPALLRALFPGMSESDALNLVENRPTEGYASLDEFLQHPSLSTSQGQQESETRPAGLGVSSHYFMLEAWSEFEPARVHLQSLLYRNDNGDVGVLSRDLGGTNWMPDVEDEPSS